MKITSWEGSCLQGVNTKLQRSLSLDVNVLFNLLRYLGSFQIIKIYRGNFISVGCNKRQIQRMYYYTYCYSKSKLWIPGHIQIKSYLTRSFKSFKLFILENCNVPYKFCTFWSQSTNYISWIFFFRCCLNLFKRLSVSRQYYGLKFKY